MARTIIRCKKHGDLPNEGHIVCRECGTSYTTHDKSLMTDAPPRCRGCGCRLLPVPGGDRTQQKFSFMPSCPECYREAPASMRGKHDPGDKRCPGEECPFHGAQIRKLKKRAEQAARQKPLPPPVSDKGVSPRPQIGTPGGKITIQIPGVLGTHTFREIERG